NARVANVEGGTPSRTHETLNWVPSTAIFTGGSALNEPQSTQSHATGTSQTMVGHGAGPLQQGIAFGVPVGQFFAGNVAISFGGGGSFRLNLTDTRTAYRAAVVTGVGGDLANRVDVVNSSWGGDASRQNLEVDAKILDAVTYEGNLARGNTIVFSAGNGGPGTNSIGAPASGHNTLAVAAL